MPAFKEMIQPTVSPKMKQEIDEATKKLGLPSSKALEIAKNPILMKFIEDVREKMV